MAPLASGKDPCSTLRHARAGRRRWVVGHLRLIGRPARAGRRVAARLVVEGDRHVVGVGELFVLIDVGANPESSSLNLMHNAVLGSNYARAALGIENPRVSLLTIGIEEGKGNSLINASGIYLQAIDKKVINYVGPIEGFQIFDGDVDVIVCDGFVGNVVLKSSEAVFGFVGNTMKEELVRNPKRIIGAALSKSAFRDMKVRLSPDQHAGAPLLGLKGNVLKSHGSSNYIAIANALRIASQIVEHDMIDSISFDINQANDLI